MSDLTIINQYALLGTATDVAQAMGALAARVEAEGEKGVLSYRFFVHDTGRAARAIIDYATPKAWIGHHDTAMAWPEMQALHRVARLEEVTFLGPMTEEIRAWLARSKLDVRLHTGFHAAAGFTRPKNT